LSVALLIGWVVRPEFGWTATADVKASRDPIRQPG